MSPPLPHQRPLERRPRAQHQAPIVVGLVNNVPGHGFKATERQFRRLLSPAAGSQPIRVRVFVLPEILRSVEEGCNLVGHYEPIDDLWASELDGVIVTGAEPQAAILGEEPYRPTLARLVDWAEARTVSAIWSCLAAQIAVHYLDGIARRSLPGKLSGLFECIKHEPHPLVEGLPSQWQVPHSRYNDIQEERLIMRGYRILARSHRTGADTFIKHGKALHVFLQGHPEYDRGALSREYRRDVRRYLTGDGERYPEMPEGYFPSDVADELRTFRKRALTDRSAALISEFPTLATADTEHAPWAGVATRFYANWLSYIADRKQSGSTTAAAIRQTLR
jgi:homoserine O-succinyltransferase/O-acetyltransferase